VLPSSIAGDPVSWIGTVGVVCKTCLLSLVSNEDGTWSVKNIGSATVIAKNVNGPLADVQLAPGESFIAPRGSCWGGSC